MRGSPAKASTTESGLGDAGKGGQPSTKGLGHRRGTRHRETASTSAEPSQPETPHKQASRADPAGCELAALSSASTYNGRRPLIDAL